MKQSQRNCCSKRSILEKILIVVVVLLLCLLIALFAVFVFHLQNSDHDKSSRVKKSYNGGLTPSPITQYKKSSVCASHQCVQASSQIIDSIDPSVDPCEDFYNFVCGNFLNKSIENLQISPLIKFDAITQNQIDGLIMEPTDEPLPKSLKFQRKFYKTCMDTEAIEKDNTYTFSRLIQQLGDWPVLHGRFWDERKFDWLRATILCRELGLSYEHFLSISLSSGRNGTGPLLLTIRPPAVIDLPNPIIPFYVDVMANISIELGAPSYLAKSEFERVYNFEKALKKNVDQSRDDQEVIITVGNLQSLLPFISWEYFLNAITKTSGMIDENALVRFSGKWYFDNLSTLLVATSKSTQANYVIWKIVESLSKYLKVSVRSRYDSFLFSLNPNYRYAANRHVFCLDSARFYFPSVAGLAYVRKYLQPSKRKYVKEITGKIKTQLLERINASYWLDASSKRATINHVSRIEEIIGTSDNAFTEDFDTVVQMKEFDLGSSNIMEMVTKLQGNLVNNMFKALNRDAKEVNKENFERSPVIRINALYNEIFNALIVPTPFLQGVMNNFQQPQYINYGALGSVIGHEFTHGFVANKNKTENTIGWTRESAANYEKKIQCLLDDYENYNGHLKGFPKSSKAVLEENISDLLGLDLAYEAYQQLVRDHGQEPTLPGLAYTQNQIFWIMSSIYHCYQPKLQPAMPSDQAHPVPSFSVISSLRNSASFASDFNCPRGSNMNPEKKCRVL